MQTKNFLMCRPIYTTLIFTFHTITKPQGAVSAMQTPIQNARCYGLISKCLFLSFSFAMKTNLQNQNNDIFLQWPLTSLFFHTVMYQTLTIGHLKGKLYFPHIKNPV